MEALVHDMLGNAVAVTILAAVVAFLRRAGRHPALIHGLCLVALLKLVTPPVVPVSMPVPPLAPADRPAGADAAEPRGERPGAPALPAGADQAGSRPNGDAGPAGRPPQVECSAGEPTLADAPRGD